MCPDSVNAINDLSGEFMSETVTVADIRLPLNNNIGGMYLPGAFVQAVYHHTKIELLRLHQNNHSITNNGLLVVCYLGFEHLIIHITIAVGC